MTAPRAARPAEVRGAPRRTTLEEDVVTSQRTVREGGDMPKRDPGPSVNDPELYEKLRDEGSSKEKAARIANAAAGSSRKSVSRKGGRSQH